VIEGSGPAGLSIGGVIHLPPLLVLYGRETGDRVLPWPVAGLDDATPDSLMPVLEGGVEILLIGCGPRMRMVPRPLRDALKAARIAVEAMDTGAACRTYNMLLLEGRLVAAALLA
jgi:uncharacterized protein